MPTARFLQTSRRTVSNFGNLLARAASVGA